MDDFVRKLKNRADMMSSDQLIFLLIPEMLERRNDALQVNNQKRVDQYSEVLDYIGTKVDMELYEIDNLDIIQNTEFIVPSPSEIINKKSPKDIPNN